MGEAGDCTNSAYLCTVGGWFKILQLIFGFIVLILLVVWEATCSLPYAHFLEMTAFMFFTMTLLIFVCILISASSYYFVGSCIYISYHCLGFIFFICGSIATLVSSPQGERSLPLVSGIMGILAAAFYGMDALLTCRERR